jgi:hypothetical protein
MLARTTATARMRHCTSAAGPCRDKLGIKTLGLPAGFTAALQSE